MIFSPLLMPPFFFRVAKPHRLSSLDLCEGELAIYTSQLEAAAGNWRVGARRALGASPNGSSLKVTCWEGMNLLLN